MREEMQKSVGDLFGEHADLYAKARPTYPSELYDYIVGLCESTDKVWDCATGTGQAALALAEKFSEVYATDINAKQIAVATKGNSTKRNNIYYSVQASEVSSFAPDTFDLVTVAQALHWFDYSKFWNELDRVLKPRGVFAAWGYDWTKIDFDLDYMLQENLFEPLKLYWNPKAKLLWGGYHAQEVGFPYKPVETPNFNIELNWDLDELFRYFLSWSASQVYIKDHGQELLIKAKEKVKTVWGNSSDKKLIQMPIHVLLGVKKKL